MQIKILIPGQKRVHEIGRKRMAFEAQMPLRTASEKSFIEVKDKDGRLIDYHDLVLHVGPIPMEFLEEIVDAAIALHADGRR